MRCYIIEAISPDDKRILVSRYAGTMADAKAKKKELADLAQVPEKSVSIEEKDIPLDKPSLLEWINNVMRDLDDEAVEEETEEPEPEPEPVPVKKARKK